MKDISGDAVLVISDRRGRAVQQVDSLRTTYSRGVVVHKELQIRNTTDETLDMSRRPVIIFNASGTPVKEIRVTQTQVDGPNVTFSTKVLSRE